MSLEIDRKSLLVGVPGAATLASVERALAAEGLTLGVPPSDMAVADWLASGAPGAPSAFTDPADHLVAGITMTQLSGRRVEVRPSPRRAVGPDLLALVVGAGERFATIDHAWIRVHVRRNARSRRAALPIDGLELDPPVSAEEALLLDAIGRELGATREPSTKR
jgi:alkyldihydroxyacetonephosphate synthase